MNLPNSNSDVHPGALAATHPPVIQTDHEQSLNPLQRRLPRQSRRVKASSERFGIELRRRKRVRGVVECDKLRDKARRQRQHSQ